MDLPGGSREFEWAREPQTEYVDWADGHPGHELFGGGKGKDCVMMVWGEEENWEEMDCEARLKNVLCEKPARDEGKSEK